MPRPMAAPSDARCSAVDRRDQGRAGWKVDLRPFVMMDIPAGDALMIRGPARRAARLSRRGGSPSIPRRRAGTVDRSAAGGRRDRILRGAPRRRDFCAAAPRSLYWGPDRWSPRRFVLHYAGSRHRRRRRRLHPLVRVARPDARSRRRRRVAMTDALISLADACAPCSGRRRSSTYAADWTRMAALATAPGGYVFPLDALWASATSIWSPSIGFRRSPTGATALSTSTPRRRAAPADAGLSRLAGRAGEAFDGTTPTRRSCGAAPRAIVDGAYGEPWVCRARYSCGWWSKPHVARRRRRDDGRTAWRQPHEADLAAELGCPPSTRAPTAPTRFPMSSPRRRAAARSRSARATISRRPRHRRDARSFRFRIAFRRVPAIAFSPVYGGRMLDVARIRVWAWDARPFPAFPALRSAVWGDAATTRPATG